MSSDLIPGDRVKLVARYAAAIMRRSRIGKSTVVDWIRRRGTVSYVQRNGTILVNWDGRTSHEAVPRKALEKVEVEVER